MCSHCSCGQWEFRGKSGRRSGYLLVAIDRQTHRQSIIGCGHQTLLTSPVVGRCRSYGNESAQWRPFSPVFIIILPGDAALLSLALRRRSQCYATAFAHEYFIHPHCGAICAFQHIRRSDSISRASVRPPIQHGHLPSRLIVDDLIRLTLGKYVCWGIQAPIKLHGYY